MATVETKKFVPSFTRGTLENIQKLITNNKLVAPAFGFCTDKKCIIFYDIDSTLYVVNADRLEAIETQLSELKDPETGETVSIKTYVSDSVEPVKEDVSTLQTQVGNVYMIINGGES